MAAEHKLRDEQVQILSSRLARCDKEKAYRRCVNARDTSAEYRRSLRAARSPPLNPSFARAPPVAVVENCIGRVKQGAAAKEKHGV